MDRATQAIGSENPQQDAPPTLDTTREASYGYISMLLVALVAVKYQASNSNLFHEHGTTMQMFLTSTFTYVNALTELRLSTNNNLRSPVLRVICHISGILTNELLLLVLVNPLSCFIITVSSILLVHAMCYCYQHVSQLLNLLDICFEWIWHLSRKDEQQSANVQMVEMEAA